MAESVYKIVELVGKIGFGVGPGYLAGQIAVVGAVGKLDDIAAPDPVDVEVRLKELRCPAHLRILNGPFRALAPRHAGDHAGRYGRLPDRAGRRLRAV